MSHNLFCPSTSFIAGLVISLTEHKPHTQHIYFSVSLLSFLFSVSLSVSLLSISLSLSLYISHTILPTQTQEFKNAYVLYVR